MASIGFIGLGNMGTAILKGLAAKGVACCGTDIDDKRVGELAETCGLAPKSGPAEVVSASDIVVIAVKPQQMKSLFAAIRPVIRPETCLVSIAAGQTIAMLKEFSGGACPVVRVMPNTPALVGAGVSAVTFEGAPGLSEELKATVMSILEAMGEVHVLAEKDFDAFTAVIGSGPAYVFYVMEALVESAVNLGLPRPAATKMVEGLMTGSAKLAAESPFSATQLREMVTSPAGTTVKALLPFDRRAVRAALIDGVTASYDRSVELGK
jgi:pyrroline-5-carboxylate reductase